MTDERPEIAHSLPIRSRLRFAQRIGEKCVVTDWGEGWLCAHGTDGIGKRGVDGPFPDVSPQGSIGVDPSQARVYYHPGDDSEGAKALIVSPDNTPFRRSSAGRVKGRSISFNEDGSPVAGVLFYYALETGRYDDRMRALESLSFSRLEAISDKLRALRTSDKLTFGDYFGEIQRAAANHYYFEDVLASHLGHLIVEEDGLSTLESWREVAKKAAQETADRIAKVSGKAPADFDANFLQAVRETTIEYGGLPAQKHVEERWIALANPGYDTSRIVPRNPGTWKTNRRKLGFDWLPPLSDWKREWAPRLQSQQSEETRTGNCSSERVS